MVIIVSGAVWAGVLVTKCVISKVLVWTALERCMRPDENRRDNPLRCSTAAHQDEEARDDGEDVPEPALEVDDDEEEEQQSVVGATKRTLSTLKRGDGREPTTREDRLQSEFSTGNNSLDSRSDGSGEGGEYVPDSTMMMVTAYLFHFYV
ncbi:unnamed protein product [Ectocarpus sp. 4 AP-2014]